MLCSWFPVRTATSDARINRLDAISAAGRAATHYPTGLRSYADREHPSRQRPGLDWAIVRPPPMTGKPLTGVPQTAYPKTLPRGWSSSRASVTHLTPRRINQPRIFKQAIGITTHRFQLVLEFPMFVAYVIVTVLAIVALGFSATVDFVRYERVISNMERAGVPESWLNTLGALKAAGALGLLVGFFVPLIGIAAAIGVILFFAGAIITHVRARWYSFGFPGAYLSLAVGALVLGLGAN